MPSGGNRTRYPIDFLISMIDYFGDNRQYLYSMAFETP